MLLFDRITIGLASKFCLPSSKESEDVCVVFFGCMCCISECFTCLNICVSVFFSVMLSRFTVYVSRVQTTVELFLLYFHCHSLCVLCKCVFLLFFFLRAGLKYFALSPLFFFLYCCSWYIITSLESVLLPTTNITTIFLTHSLLSVEVNRTIAAE